MKLEEMSTKQLLEDFRRTCYQTQLQPERAKYEDIIKNQEQELLSRYEILEKALELAAEYVVMYGGNIKINMTIDKIVELFKKRASNELDKEKT